MIKQKIESILFQWKTPEIAALVYTCLFLGLQTQVDWIFNDIKKYKENYMIFFLIFFCAQSLFFYHFFFICALYPQFSFKT